MNVAIRQHQTSLTDDLQSLLQDRLRTELSRLGKRVQRVQVFFADINGGRGGIDKLCRVVAHVRRQPPLVVVDRDRDLAALIVRICQRVGSVAQRRRVLPRNRHPRISMSGE